MIARLFPNLRPPGDFLAPDAVGPAKRVVVYRLPALPVIRKKSPCPITAESVAFSHLRLRGWARRQSKVWHEVAVSAVQIVICQVSFISAQGNVFPRNPDLPIGNVDRDAYASLVPAFHSDATGSPGRRGGDQPQTLTPRRICPPTRVRFVFFLVSGQSFAAEDRQTRARRDGSLCPGTLPARASAARDLGIQRPLVLCGARHVPPLRPRRA